MCGGLCGVQGVVWAAQRTLIFCHAPHISLPRTDYPANLDMRCAPASQHRLRGL